MNSKGFTPLEIVYSHEQYRMYTRNLQQRKSLTGFTLIEILIGSGLLLIVFSGILSMYVFSLKVISQSQSRVVATALANQRMEAIRNLPYNDVGTIGGVPAGQLAQNENVSSNGSFYSIQTIIVFIDDAFDGLSPADTLSTDYKRVKIIVSWQGRFGGDVVFMTDVAPKGIETAVYGGTLALSVFDAQGAGVGQASLHIVNNEVFPFIDATYQTDNNGNFILPGVPASLESYQIAVSKNGYSSERTYARDEVVGSVVLANPSYVHASIFEGQVTSTSFSVDEVSSFSFDITTVEDGEQRPVPNVVFTARGAKILGTDEDEEPVLKYEQEYVTNGVGHIDIANMEWDSYGFSVNKAATGLDLLSSNPAQPVSLLPAVAQTVVLNVKAEHTLLVTVRDSQTQEPVFGVQVRLYNASLSYDATQPTDEIGQTFFIPLAADEYTLVVQMTGYQPETSAVSVAGATARIIYITAQ